MTDASGQKRIDRASRTIMASPHTIYQALVDPEAVASWLAPEGMTARIYAFDPRAGGAYRLALTYDGSDHSAPGKTSDHSDVVEGQFLELVPNERMVQRVEFQSGDPAFAGAMTITWTLAAAAKGTEVTILCENVPEGIRPEDHDAGLRATLENLAAFTE